MAQNKSHVAIIGAGIIGTSVACFLAEKGFCVTVFDPEEAGRGGASQGNASQIIPGLVFPLASTQTLKDAGRLITGKNGPLSIPMAYALQMLPWLIGFARSATTARYRHGVDALTALNQNAYSCLEALLQNAGLQRMLKRQGAILLYESEQTVLKGEKLWRQVPSSLVGELTILNERDLRHMEPALGPSLKSGIHLQQVGVLSDPLEVVTGLAKYAQARSVRFIRSSVRNLSVQGHTAHLILANGQSCTFDKVVIAAGVWSRRFLRDLGEPQLLQAERGYNLTLSVSGATINHALIFVEHGVVATQLSCGLRFGGWDELGGTRLPANPKLFERLERLASEVLPSFDWQEGRRWMGHRPSLPHSLPIIGPSRKHKSVYYAFGHGHLGMTQGAITGKAIAALIAGEEPPFNLAPFAVN